MFVLYRYMICSKLGQYTYLVHLKYNIKAKNSWYIALIEKKITFYMIFEFSSSVSIFHLGLQVT